MFCNPLMLLTKSTDQIFVNRVLSVHYYLNIEITVKIAEGNSSSAQFDLNRFINRLTTLGVSYRSNRN